jgi:hypothetical protein
MPDLKSELKKLETLKFDDEGESNVITLPAATALPDDQQGGVSSRFFNVIRDNPGCNRKRILSLAETANVSKASSSSLLAQFVKRGLVRTVDSASGTTYFSIGQKYKPGYIKQAKKGATKTKAVTAAPAPVQAVIPAPVTLASFSAQDMLDSMPVGKARALYVELKKLFEV